jgi:serine/threonine-protein kinase RsbW
MKRERNNKLKMHEPGAMKRIRNKLKLHRPGDLPWTSVEISSSLDQARCVEEQILGRCKDCTFSEHDLFALKLALEEALVNAVKHGNKMDPAKHVRVEYRITPQRADVAIEDEGPGFNPAAVPNPCDDENLECNHGRGILLMRAYMSSVVFSPSGNKVTLTKFNDSFNPMPSSKQAAMG